MDGKIIEGIDSPFVEIPFTKKNALQLRTFLRTKTYHIPEREKHILKFLADTDIPVDDPNIIWEERLTDLQNKTLEKIKGIRKIKTEWDLLHYLPLRYLDRSNPQSIKEFEIGGWAVVAGEIVSIQPNWEKKYVKIVVSDIRNDRISATFFRQMWLTKKHKIGEPVILYGNYSEYVNHRGGKFPQITNPKIDTISSEQQHNNSGYGMLPIYPQKEQQKSWAIKNAQEKMINKIVWIEDPVPEPILKKYKLMSRTEAYKKIHFPENQNDVTESRRRIAFDEYMRLQVYVYNSRQNNLTLPSQPKTETRWAKMFENSLPFSFTNAQKRVINEILTDMSKTAPMYRLLQGDVGSGKAQPLHSKILTPNGWTTMKQIQPGQQIVNPINPEKPATVISTHRQGYRETWKLIFNDNTSVEADVNHLWKLADRKGLFTTKEIVQLHNHGKTILIPKYVDEKLEKIQLIKTVKANIQETKCIKLDTNEGLYVTDNHIVTHNTEISSVAALTSTESGYQVAMLAPTDILATQLFERLQETFVKAGIGEDKLKIALYNGRVLGKKREKLLKELKEGSIHIVVGTHALANKNVEFNNLGLAIIDEMHKFGSEQRTNLRKINSNNTIPDLLMMSATPIPRTMSQVLFGNLDISVVDELPVGRLPVITEWNTTPDAAWERIDEEVKKGHQAYVVTALVEDSEKIVDVESAIATYTDLKNNIFPHHRVGLLHGKLNKQEKADVINAFYNHEVDILVATSVVEVGVNVPNSTVMTILDANRFGIASLHQIRGRVGRSNIQSYCYLVGETDIPETQERLNALVSSNDGFWLAEKDLEIRGEGTLFDKIQSGDSDLYVGNLKEHKDLLDITQRVAAQASKSLLLNQEIDILYSDKTILA